jgi:chromosomal replication initiation ATPase DnaA
MTQGKRSGLSAVQKSDMWCRWKTGQSLHEIGRAFGKSHSSIRCLVSVLAVMIHSSAAS